MLFSSRTVVVNTTTWVLVLVLVLYRVVVVDLSWSRVRCFALGLGVRCFWYGKERWGLVSLSRCFDGLHRIRNAEEVLEGNYFVSLRYFMVV
jgi:hypothetical protein